MLLLQLRRGSSNGNKKLNRGGTAGGSPTGAPPTTDALESTTASASDNKRCYRAQLEQEVLKLQQQLQEEINLHVALANAAGHNTLHLLNTSCHLPDKAQELLSSVAALEITVSKLEDELVSLHFRLSQERNVRHLAEHNVMQSPSPPSHSSTACCPSYSWDEQLSSLRISKCDQIPDSLQPDSFADSGHSPSSTLQRLDDASDANLGDEKLAGSCMLANGKEETDSKGYTNGDLSSFCLERDLYHHPNRLSEEMVRCMRNIFLCLSESSTVTSKISSLDCIPRPSSPNGHLSFSSLTSFSSSSAIPSLSASPSTEICNCCEDTESARTFDPYRVHGKVNQTNIGSYSSAAEVSWMTVGEKQLEYAAKALKQFRFLVEQLAKVNPAVMTCNQRLAFWINLYNALIMHAYLAYGVPKSDMKLFSLMQKASYTVGGHSFSAADIEYVILKMKPPAHRPQIALILALHKFKISEEHRKYSIDDPEPLAVFALSCGMYSSPAIQIFTADNIKEELQISLRDYVRASVGINDKGKLLVPKLVHCFAKGVVEDSLLVDWICRFLTPEQLSLVRDSASQRKQRLLGARGFTVVPFESRFRYLFLPDKESPTHSS